MKDYTDSALRRHVIPVIPIIPVPTNQIELPIGTVVILFEKPAVGVSKTVKSLLEIFVSTPSNNRPKEKPAFGLLVKLDVINPLSSIKPSLLLFPYMTVSIVIAASFRMRMASPEEPALPKARALILMSASAMLAPPRSRYSPADNIVPEVNVNKVE